MSFPVYPSYIDTGIEWIGAIPASWRIARVKNLFAIVNGGTPRAERPDFWDGDIAWITPADFPGEYPTSIKSSIRKISRDGLLSCSATMVPKGCIVISTRAPIGSLAVPEIEICFNQGCKGLIPFPQIDPTYYLFVFESARENLNLQGRGTTFLELSTSALASFQLPLPSWKQQTEIAKFLNSETAKIDELIFEQELLINLLLEKRKAVILHATTKGVVPCVAMKESGIEWIGRVPESWTILPLKRIALTMCDGPFGSGLKSDHYTKTGVRVVRLQNIRDFNFNSTDEAYIDPDYFQQALNRHDVKGGDLLIAGLGDDRNSVGRACVAPSEIEPAMVKADCFRLRLNGEMAVTRFVAIQLSVGASFDAGNLASGATRSRISLSAMATRRVALPPVSEQVLILSALEKTISPLDLLIQEARQAVFLLKERRAALISAVTTGKIGVSGLPEREPSAHAAAA